MVSLVCHFTSTQQDESLGLQADEIAAQWVRFTVIVAAAALNTKAVALWSESRMLRKVRARNQSKLRDSLVSENHDHTFTELYVSLSKGRHRTYSRYYPLLFYLFTFAIDVIDVAEFLAGDSFNSDIISSEELTAFRLFIYVGSFTTFGAVNLTIAESSLMVFCNLAIATLNIVFGYGFLRLSSAVQYVLNYVQLTLIGSFVFMWIIQRNGEHHISLPGIVSRMASVREDNFHNPDLEQIDLRGALSGQQSSRLEKMEELAVKYRDFDVKKARELTSWWSVEIGDFMVFFVVSALSAMILGQVPPDQVPRIVFFDCLEGISVYLLYINNTVAENVLFVKLLQIANLPKSGLHNVSSVSRISEV